MFDSSYEYTFVTKSGNDGELYKNVRTYTFRCKDKYRYILLAEEYEYEVFAIKFYLKNHADSEDRFKINTNYFNALTIFGTCLRVMQGLVKEHPAASFFIFGSQSHKDKLNAPSQRFRIYQRMIENVFSPVNFYHYALSIRSIYLVLNKKNEEPEATLTYLTQLLEDKFELQLKDT